VASSSTTSVRPGTNTTGPIVRAQAKLRYSTVTPMKARRVIDLVRGLPADEALAVLRFTPQSAGEPVYKVLESAIANARYAASLRQERLEVEDLESWSAEAETQATKRSVPKRVKAATLLRTAAPVAPTVEEKPAKKAAAKKVAVAETEVAEKPAKKAAAKAPKAAAEKPAKKASTAAKKTSPAKAAEVAESDTDSTNGEEGTR
jgi:large subunit ribosomal protein L22